MEHEETKYLVNDFDAIQELLHTKGAVKKETVRSTHYYAQQQGNHVTKLVSYGDRNEIHTLREENETYTLTEKIPVENKEAGFTWLKHKGYSEMAVVSMNHTDYTYKNGVVGLYVINGDLYSVILDFPKPDHHAMENEFGLDHESVLSVPYDKYLTSTNHLKTVLIP
jgi:hypothetical protein